MNFFSNTLRDDHATPEFDWVEMLEYAQAQDYHEWEHPNASMGVPNTPASRRVEAERELFPGSPTRLHPFSEWLEDDAVYVSALPLDKRAWLQTFAAWLDERDEEKAARVELDGDPRDLSLDPILGSLWMRFLREQPLRESFWMAWCYFGEASR